MIPYPGLMVLYRQREPRAGQLDLAAMVTRAWPDGRVDLNVYPPMAEFYQLPKVPMLSDVFTSNVWLMAPSEIGASRADAMSALDEVTMHAGLSSMIERMEARILGLEAKRGPGRPPKAEQAA